MRPFLHRGQAPAKGILHTEQRTPARARTNSNGDTFTDSDPRGYWLGQSAAPTLRRERRLWVAMLGRRQYLKNLKERRRG